MQTELCRKTKSRLSDDEEDVINIVFIDGHHGKGKRYRSYQVVKNSVKIV